MEYGVGLHAFSMQRLDAFSVERLGGGQNSGRSKWPLKGRL